MGEPASPSGPLRSVPRQPGPGVPVHFRPLGERTERLDLATKPFAERRMNQHMQEAIGGKDVGEIEKKVEHAKGTEHHGG